MKGTLSRLATLKFMQLFGGASFNLASSQLSDGANIALLNGTSPFTTNQILTIGSNSLVLRSDGLFIRGTAYANVGDIGFSITGAFRDGGGIRSYAAGHLQLSTDYATTDTIMSMGALRLQTGGAAPTAGIATLSGGTPGAVTINTTAVQAGSIILLTYKTKSATTLGSLEISAISAGVSFTITAFGSAVDASTVSWAIINAAP